MAGRTQFRFRYFRYRKAIEGTIARSVPVHRRLGELAAKGAAAGQAIAPVGPWNPGEYRDSIKSDVRLTPQGLRGRFYSDDFKSYWIEFGTSDTPAFHVLQRAAQTLGLPWRRVGS